MQFWWWLLLACALLVMGQSTKPKPGAGSAQPITDYLRWGGGARVSGNCLELNGSGAAVDAGGPCSLPTGAVLFYNGTRTAGHCVEFDSEGRAVDAGHACGSGSGEGGVSWTFIDAEVPSGTINGSNANFTLAHAPSPSTSLKLFRNGLRLKYSDDYTLSGNTITFGSNAKPQTGDLLLAEYRY